MTGLVSPGENNCFAVFVMPDTQVYTMESRNDDDPDGNGYPPWPEYETVWLQRIAQWICANKGDFNEPFSGAQMRLANLLHLGDIVQSNEHNRTMSYSGASCDRNKCEWDRIDSVFDILDACEMPYLAIPGNHDWKGSHSGNEHETLLNAFRFDEYFGEGDGTGGANIHGRAFANYRCGNGAPGAIGANCDGVSQWYLGGGGNQVAEAQLPVPGNLIGADSRTEDAATGPSMDNAGRHRAGFARAPDGSPFLFIGLEFTPSLHFATSWPAALMSANADVPTLLFNHQGFTPGEIWDALITPFPQVYGQIHGHVINGVRSYSVELADGSAYVVPKNNARLSMERWGARLECPSWSSILTRGEVRIRSYQFTGQDLGSDMGPVSVTRMDDPANGGAARPAPHLVYPLRPAEFAR